MVVIDAITVPEVVPRCRCHIFAPVFIPFDVGLIAQDACTFLADIGYGKERPDVEAHAIVEIGNPADGLLLDGFPAHEDVVGRFAFENQL